MKKKVLASLLAVTSLVCSVSATGVSRVDEENVPPQYVEVIDFPMLAAEDLSEYEVGLQNMRALGFSEKVIDTVPFSEVCKYADVTSGIVSTQYIKVSYALPGEEIMPLSDDDQEFFVVSADEVDQLESYHSIITKEQYEEEAAATKALQESLANVMPVSEISDDVRVFNGYMTLTATVATISGTTSKYLVSGDYEWTTEPTKRYTDIFAIAPDTGAYFLNSSLDVYYSCKYRQEVTSVNGSTTVYTGTKASDYDTYNDWEYKSGGGYGVAVKMWKNGTDPFTELPFGGSCVYTDFVGYASGEMVVREPQTYQNMKIVVGYAQQTKSGSISSVSVSIPPAVGISISGSSKHDIKACPVSFSHPNFTVVN